MWRTWYCSLYLESTWPCRRVLGPRCYTADLLYLRTIHRTVVCSTAVLAPSYSSPVVQNTVLLGVIFPIGQSSAGTTKVLFISHASSSSSVSSFLPRSRLSLSHLLRQFHVISFSLSFYYSSTGHLLTTCLPTTTSTTAIYHYCWHCYHHPLQLPLPLSTSHHLCLLTLNVLHPPQP